MMTHVWKKKNQGYIQNENQIWKLFYKQIQMLLDGLNLCSLKGTIFWLKTLLS